ncbi:MAG: glycosyltransferase [Ignavibacteriaceae bacterium]|nr:glycosyltransferase [Ignavibacteriaceae bacterium]
MKQLLFITYFWPPSGKATLHWPLKIIKYLPDNNWQPIVLTADEDTFTQKDFSLLEDIDPKLKVFKSKTYEPFNFYKKFIGKKPEEKLIASETISLENKSLTHRISIWIRMNLFIPDSRIGWYLSAVKTGEKIISNNKIDAIVTIGPPHSTHLIGKKLSRKFNIPFIPVFIDPWVDIIYYKGFKRSRLTLKIDNKLEKSVLEQSSHTVFVTESMKEDYINKHHFIKDKSSVLYWGYNEDDFANLKSTRTNMGEKVLVHAGNIFDYQNPENLWKVIRSRIDGGEKFRIKFLGTIAPLIRKSIEQNGLTDITEYIGFLPYKEMLRELLNTDYLLVCATEKRHVPGKLFEYLRTGKPIIAFGQDNEEVENILKEANAGMLFKYDDDVNIFFESADQFNSDINRIRKFNREMITQQFSNILNRIYS